MPSDDISDDIGQCSLESVFILKWQSPQCNFNVSLSTRSLELYDNRNRWWQIMLLPLNFIVWLFTQCQMKRQLLIDRHYQNGKVLDQFYIWFLIDVSCMHAHAILLRWSFINETYIINYCRVRRKGGYVYFL